VWGGVMIIGDAMILDPCFRDPGIWDKQLYPE